MPHKRRRRWRRRVFVQRRIFLDRIFAGRMQYAPTRVSDSFLFFDLRFSDRVGAFSFFRFHSYNTVGAYCIRPQTPPEAANDRFCALANLFVSFGNVRRAYAIRPYLGTFLFFGFHSCNTVKAQQHTPTNATGCGEDVYLCSVEYSLIGYLWGVCNTPLHGYLIRSCFLISDFPVG